MPIHPQAATSKTESPAHSPAQQSRLVRIVSVASVLYFLAHCFLVLFGPEKGLMDWLYDDSFYYLIVAKHFAELHVPSFDGTTLTNGYHPLWMWLCSAIYRLHSHLDLTYIRLCMALSIVISGTILSAALLKFRKTGEGWLWALALCATSYSAFNNGLTIMEWPLVILFWLLLHLLLTREVISSVASPASLGTLVSAFLLGFAGSLSRTDFGLIAAAYFAAGILLGRKFRTWRPAIASLVALVGSAAGVAAVTLYNHATTGSWIQQSAQVKHLYATISAPFNPVPAAWQFARVLLYLPPLDLSNDHRAQFLHYGVLALIICILVSAFAIRGRLRTPPPTWTARSSVGTFSIAASLFGIIGYLFLYSFNSQATFGWYSATVTGFVLILTARLFQLAGPRISATIGLPLIFLNLAGLAYGGPNARSQYQEVRIGLALHRDHPTARMGGGDVGKPSFYNGGTMVNLDGLMNNEIYPYLAAGTFHCYVLNHHIEYLSDVGSITMPITNGVRDARQLPPLPWATYFAYQSVLSIDGTAVTYLKTDFSAIQRSGECNVAAH